MWSDECGVMSVEGWVWRDECGVMSVDERVRKYSNAGYECGMMDMK